MVIPYRTRLCGRLEILGIKQAGAYVLNHFNT